MRILLSLIHLVVKDSVVRPPTFLLGILLMIYTIGPDISYWGFLPHPPMFFFSSIKNLLYVSIKQGTPL